MDAEKQRSMTEDFTSSLGKDSACVNDARSDKDATVSIHYELTNGCLLLENMEEISGSGPGCFFSPAKFRAVSTFAKPAKSTRREHVTAAILN